MIGLNAIERRQTVRQTCPRTFPYSLAILYQRPSATTRPVVPQPEITAILATITALVKNRALESPGLACRNRLVVALEARPRLVWTRWIHARWCSACEASEWRSQCAVAFGLTRGPLPAPPGA